MAGELTGHPGLSMVEIWVNKDLRLGRGAENS